MTETIKVLGQSIPVGGTLTDIYTAVAAAVISSVVICNRSRDAATFRLSVAVAGAADEEKQYLYYDEEIPGNETFILTLGLTLAATDVLRGYSNNSSLAFNVFGTEIS